MILTGELEVPGENNAKFQPLASRMPNGMIRARTRASAVTDRLRHDRATVVVLCDIGKRQCLHLGSLI